jgi:hypothetical protein
MRRREAYERGIMGGNHTLRINNETNIDELCAKQRCGAAAFCMGFRLRGKFEAGSGPYPTYYIVRTKYLALYDLNLYKCELNGYELFHVVSFLNIYHCSSAAEAVGADLHCVKVSVPQY